VRGIGDVSGDASASERARIAAAVAVAENAAALLRLGDVAGAQPLVHALSRLLGLPRTQE